MSDSLHQFHVCGFETVAVVYDGAAANMTTIKEMSGDPRKAYRFLIKAHQIYLLQIQLDVCMCVGMIQNIVWMKGM